jgi:hypothetical protein
MITAFNIQDGLQEKHTVQVSKKLKLIKQYACNALK